MALYKSIELKNADIDMNKRQISGYAATWDQDQVGDIIHKGAFKKTITESKKSVKVMYNHKNLIGKPIEMYEDSVGLATVSEIAETTQGEDILTLAKGGFLTEMSIQFNIPQHKSTTEADGIRHIKEIKLFEYGPVDFPANNGARILDVKSIRDQILEGNRYSLKDIDELMNQLVEMKALLKSEPPKGTHYGQQPQELDAIKMALKTFGL